MNPQFGSAEGSRGVIFLEKSGWRLYDGHRILQMGSLQGGWPKGVGISNLPENENQRNHTVHVNYIAIQCNESMDK